MLLVEILQLLDGRATAVMVSKTIDFLLNFVVPHADSIAATGSYQQGLLRMKHALGRVVP